MSPRQNRRRMNQRRKEQLQPGQSSCPERTEDWPDGRWMVRDVSGAAAGKHYRCPGCDQQIHPGTPHLVAWPASGLGGTGERRHWHPPCWQQRLHRAPNPPRRPRR